MQIHVTHLKINKLIDNNITGTNKLIEAIESNNISKVVYASSSCYAWSKTSMERK